MRFDSGPRERRSRQHPVGARGASDSWFGVALVAMVFAFSLRAALGMTSLVEMLRIEEAERVGLDWILPPAPPVSGTEQALAKIGGALFPLALTLSLFQVLRERRGGVICAVVSAVAFCAYLAWLRGVTALYTFLGPWLQDDPNLFTQIALTVIACLVAGGYASRDAYADAPHGPRALVRRLRRVRVAGPYPAGASVVLMLLALSAAAYGTLLLSDIVRMVRFEDAYASSDRQKTRMDMKIPLPNDVFGRFEKPLRVFGSVVGLAFAATLVSLARGAPNGLWATAGGCVAWVFYLTLFGRSPRGIDPLLDGTLAGMVRATWLQVVSALLAVAVAILFRPRTARD
ncbi:MAG: hypothetical protein HY608_09755 [Planctomycetes bacterium]|nr:hypothetical protein [Planctomycetota bacterium]